MKGKALITAAALCLIPLPGRSQGASIVYDPTSFGGILKQIYTDIQNHYDDVVMTEEQISTALSILETAEDFSAKMDNVYNRIQPVMEKTRILYTAGSSIQSDYRALTDAYGAYADMFNRGEITLDRLNRALRKTNSLMRIVKDDYDIISTCLSSSMSTKDKMDTMNDAVDDSRMAAQEIRRDVQDLRDSVDNALTRAARDSAIYGIMRNKPSRASAALDIDWSAQGVSADEFDNSSPDEAAEAIKNNNQPLFSLVEIILGILFIISLAWGGLLYLKGDPQHQDTLFKIALGLGFVVVVLEILRTVLF